jgi:hypothetical protein
MFFYQKGLWGYAKGPFCVFGHVPLNNNDQNHFYILYPFVNFVEQKRSNNSRQTSRQ